jgi:hypothetical protein
LATHSPPATRSAGPSANAPAPVAATSQAAIAAAQLADSGAADDLDLFSGLDLAVGGGAEEDSMPPSGPPGALLAAPPQPIAGLATVAQEAASQLAEMPSGVSSA